MARLSKRLLLLTAVAAAAGLSVLGYLVFDLRRELGRAVGTIDDLSARTRAQQDELARLEARLGQVGGELVDVRRLEAEARARLLAELETRTGAESSSVRADLDALEEHVRALRTAADEHARLLAAAQVDEDVEARYRELMAPTVRINARREVGSGTVVWSRSTGDGARTYVLTAWHIVEDHRTADGNVPLSVDFFEAGRVLRTERGIVAAAEPDLDLALVEIDGRAPYASLARLPERAAVAAVQVFAPVHAIGCPLGYAPIPTSGELTSRDKELEGRTYWMVSAPTIFGNSGGGIYLARSHLLVGVLSRISAYKTVIDVAVPHMGLVVPVDRVYDWLDRTAYAFVYRDRLEAASTLPASHPAPPGD